MLWLTMRLMRADQTLREDALISVKRGFRPREWVEPARCAEIRNAKVWLYYGTRIVLQTRRRALTQPPTQPALRIGQRPDFARVVFVNRLDGDKFNSPAGSKKCDEHGRFDLKMVSGNRQVQQSFQMCEPKAAL